MPDAGQTCVMPDGSTIDLTGATPDEVAICLTNPSATLRLEMDVDGQDRPKSLHRRVIPMPPTDEAVSLPAPIPESATPPVVPHEEQPDAPSVPPNEIAQLVQSTGGGALGLVAALIAVVGGTAAFKLWTKISEQKHEQQMKRLDIEQTNAGLGGAQPPPCQTAHQTLVADIKALQSKIAELEGRTGKVEKSTAGISPTVDVEDLEERVKVIEKAIRRKSPSHRSEG